MLTAQEIFDQLAAPFPDAVVSWRIGMADKSEPKAKALPYIDARDVMDRFDAVVGPGNWQDEFINAGNGATCCRIGVFVPDLGWVWKADGAGQTDVEGDKGQFSDAFKRAAVKWGVGRYLYSMKSPWVPTEGEGKFRKFTKDALHELAELHRAEVKKMGWGGTEARHVGNAIRLVDSAIMHFVTQPSEALDFQNNNEGVLASMPKAAREHVLNTLARVGQRAAE